MRTYRAIILRLSSHSYQYHLLFFVTLGHTHILLTKRKHNETSSVSYTSPFVRKLSILLLEKGITFEFINELPYNADNGVAQFNPLEKCRCW